MNASLGPDLDLITQLSWYAEPLYDAALKATLSRAQVVEAAGRNVSGDALFALAVYAKEPTLSCTSEESLCTVQECCGASVLPTCSEEFDAAKGNCECDIYCDEDEHTALVKIYMEATNGQNPFVRLDSKNLTFNSNEDDVRVALLANLDSKTLEALADKDDFFSHAHAVGGLAFFLVLAATYL